MASKTTLKILSNLYALILLCVFSFNIHALDIANYKLNQAGFESYAISVSDDPAFVNTPFTYKIDLTNSGTSILSSVSFSVTKPPQLSLISFTGGPGINCSEMSTEISCSDDGSLNLSPGATLSGALVITTQSTSFIGTVITDVLDSTATVQVVASIQSEIIENNSVNLKIIKTASVSTIETNKAFSYNILVENITQTSSIPTNIVVIDTLPTGVILNSINSGLFTCSGTSTITCTLNNFTVNSFENIILNVTSPDTAGVITNNANISADQDDSSLGDNFSSVNVSVTEPEILTVVDLSLNKTASASELLINSDFQYTLEVTNNGTDLATNINLTDVLPNGVVLNSIEAGLFNCSGTTTIECLLPSLDTGKTQSVRLNVKSPNQVGTVTNLANVTSEDQDSNTANNESQVSVDIIQNIADLEITTTGSVQIIGSGNQFSFNSTIINNGPSDAQNVVITIQIPVGFEQVSAISDNNTSCIVSATDVVCTLISLSDQATTNIDILGTGVLAEGALQTVATVTSDTSDSNSDNNSDSASVTVERFLMADLSLTLDNSSNLNQGSHTDIQLNITNNGPDAAIQPELTIALTGLLESVSVIASTGWDCQTANLNLSCQYTSGSMPSGAQSNIQLNVITTQVVLAAEDLTINANIVSSTVDPNLTNNTINDSIAIRGTPTEEEIFTALQTALNGQGNQQVNRSIRNVASYCERSYFMALESFCNDLYNTALAGDGETINNVMEQITPNEVIGQSTSVAEMATAQFRNVGTRLAQLRSSGGSGFSSAGLNARYGSGSLPLGMLAYLNDDNTQSDDDFISPWGFFVNGTISMGDRDATGRELEFDFDTFGITAGVDYRLDAKKVLGFALGYANFDSNVDNDTAELNSSGLTLTGYGSFYATDNLYIDTRISLAKPDFDQSREIDFTLGGTHIQRAAKGDTSANQYSVAMSTGYHWSKASWNITPNASFQYVKTSIDQFTETGAGDFNFFYDNQEIESFTVSAGLKLSKAISISNGVITPQLDFDLIHEAKNNGTNIEARFINAPIDEIFIIETDTPDKNYGTAALGLVYISSNGKQAYINYRRTLGLQGFSSDTFNIGARFEF